MKTASSILHVTPDITHIIVTGGMHYVEEIPGTVAVIKHAAQLRIPVLGICLGSMAILVACGGTTERIIETNAKAIRTESVRHLDLPIFSEVATPFKAVCAHHELVKTTGTAMPVAWSDTKEVMAIQHPHLPLYGFQFHPEHPDTEQGSWLITNFFRITQAQSQVR